MRVKRIIIFLSGCSLAFVAAVSTYLLIVPRKPLDPHNPKDMQVLLEMSTDLYPIVMALQTYSDVNGQYPVELAELAARKSTAEANCEECTPSTLTPIFSERIAYTRETDDSYALIFRIGWDDSLIIEPKGRSVILFYDPGDGTDVVRLPLPKTFQMVPEL